MNAAQGAEDFGSQAIAGFLDRLAARQAAPGGGGTAALSAAQAAALLAMVARYSDGPRYAAHADTIAAMVGHADRLRNDCLGLAAADAEAFGAVARGYAMPKQTAEQKAARSVAIASALVGAAAPQAAIIVAAAGLLDLIETLLPIGNRNVISDLAAGAETLRAAVAIARLNVQINLAGITDKAVRGHYDEVVAGVDGLMARAARVTETVTAAATLASTPGIGNSGSRNARAAHG